MVRFAALRLVNRRGEGERDGRQPAVRHEQHAVALRERDLEVGLAVAGDGHHDAEIPGFGPIPLLSRDEARQVRIRNGEPLPLLSEVLDLVGNREVYVEIKSLPEVHDQELLAVLDRGPVPHRYSVHSFDERRISPISASRLRSASRRIISAMRGRWRWSFSIFWRPAKL